MAGISGGEGKVGRGKDSSQAKQPCLGGAGAERLARLKNKTETKSETLLSRKKAEGLSAVLCSCSPQLSWRVPFTKVPHPCKMLTCPP